ncbi:MAG: beta-Ala-His dipeptidase [Clostridiales bacterium]|nr:beta-Ala-His dipeptidase [Clostridiales bacterium]
MEHKTGKTPLEFFKEICKIPHGSGNVRKIADYIENFAVERGLSCYRDENDTLLIRREACAGYEDKAPLLIQGHIDMVCEHDPDVKIDMETEGLTLCERDGWLFAKGTTLGADDGAAVAIMLALLDDENLRAPMLECLFTTDEETGMTGASGFDYGRIKSRRMLNLDSGGEVVIVSCAGGLREFISDTPKCGDVSGNILTLEITGLSGGHSGIDIDKNHANANLLMLKLIEAADGRIISLHGGSKENAIPSSCRAEIYVEDAVYAISAITEAEAEIRDSLVTGDCGMKLSISKRTGTARAPEADFTKRLLKFTSRVPVGVISYNEDVGMVETSLNYAVIDVTADGFTLALSSRSSVDGRLDSLSEEITSLADECGFSCKSGAAYSGWEYAPNSPVRDEYITAYREVTGRELEVMGIHAGLECGIIKNAVPDMDIISTGVVTLDEHTPRERMEIASLSRVYEVVKKMACSR